MVGKLEMNNASRKLLATGAVVALTWLGNIAYTNAQDIQAGTNQGTIQSDATETPGKLQLSNSSYQPGVNKVTFQSEGETMVGSLYLPADYQPGDKLPTVLVTGSWTTVKEQMADLYAKRLVDQGFATFTFDFRFYGESGGEPRQYESPAAKIQDIKNAVTYLQSLPMIDAKRIGGLGVCASAGYMAHAIASGVPIKSFVTVAAWLHDPETVGLAYGGEAGVRRRVEAGLSARKEYEQTGQVAYVPAYAQDNPDAAMTGEADYYNNPERGVIPQWKNQFAVMSWSEWLQFDALAPAPKIEIPTLFVHTDNSAFPDNVRRFYNAMPGQKELFWTEGFHSDFYDREPFVTRAVQATAEHFKDTL